MGHDLRLCAGELDALRYQARLVPPMHFNWPPAARVTAAAFDPGSDPVAVRTEIERLADLLLPVLHDWVRVNSLDLVVMENAWAIDDLPLGVALRRGRRRSSRPSATTTTTGGSASASRSASCRTSSRRPFPPDLPWIRHVSINSLAATELKRPRDRLEGRAERLRLRPAAPPSSGRRRNRLRRELGMPDAGLLVVQPTRVVPRKGIELAIELVGRLDDPDAVLLITSPAGDEGSSTSSSSSGSPRGTRCGWRTRRTGSRPISRASRSVRRTRSTTRTSRPTSSPIRACTRGSATRCWRRSSTACRSS